MFRFARLAAAVFSLPFAWALARVFVDVLCLASGSCETSFPVESAALLGGAALFLLSWKFLPGLTRVYVLGHELTHAVWGLAFGAKVSGLRVRKTGGSVTLSKTNVWITLAPYFFPFWTAVVALLALALKGVMHFTHPGMPLPLPRLWMCAAGFTWCFHLCFTLKALMQTQPDVQEYGRVFSWTFIFVSNVAGMLAVLLCTTSVPVRTVADGIVSRTTSAYAASYGFIAGCAALFVDGVRSLLS